MMNKCADLKVQRAAAVIHNGGIIAYPTESVYGLGCDPYDETAVSRILDLKQRGRQPGLILIGDTDARLAEWIAPTPAEKERLFAAHDVITWIVTASPHTPRWVTGGRSTVAVRVTQHPVAAAICNVAGTAIVSTSANRHGHAAAKTALSVRCKFGAQIDYIMPGIAGPRVRPSEIRDARTGAVLRPA